MAMSLEQISQSLKINRTLKPFMEDINQILKPTGKQLTYYQMQQLKQGDGNVASFAKETVEKYLEGKLGEV